MKHKSSEKEVATVSSFLQELEPVGTLLLGNLESNDLLHQLHSEVTSFLSHCDVYDELIDLAHSVLNTNEGDPDVHEFIEADSVEGSASQIVLFDMGTQCALDIGLRLAPFVHNGKHCKVVSIRDDESLKDVAHELVSVFNIIS